MICPNCGSTDENKRFCTRCGQRLLDDRTSASPIAEGAQQPFNTSLQGQATDNLTRQILDQRYYLVAKIGVGEMGTVYRARRLQIGDAVAVKILHPDLVTNPTAVERFRREAQTAAQFKHPNVVNIYDFGVSQEGLIYLVMELVEGESLRQMIEQQGTLTPPTAAEITRQICAALEEMHQQGVVHSDIKPENILWQVTPVGLQVKILNFGIAALRDITASKLARTGGVIGTPHYMSPEQCMGEELDGRSDIYSLGIVLYEMLTGVVPFDSLTTTAVIVQQVNQPPPPMRTLNANIPPEVEAVVLNTLEKQRTARPQTAGALARELIAAVNGVSSVPAQSAIPPMYTGPAFGTPPAETPFSFQNGSEPASQDAEPIFSKERFAANKRGKLVPLLFGMILLIAVGGGLGFWWYFYSGKTEQAANNNPASGQQPATVALPRNTQPTAEPSAGTKPLPLGGKIWDVIADQTGDVSQAENALGAPDQQVAVIAPRGQLALAFLDGQFFGDGPGADLRVYGPEQDRVSYDVFVKDGPTTPWQRIDINRRGFPPDGRGHDIGHHGVRRARQVMIKNRANTDLSLDAVTVVYKDTVSNNRKRRRR